MSIVINSYKPKKIEKREPKIQVNQDDYYYMQHLENKNKKKKPLSISD